MAKEQKIEVEGKVIDINHDLYKVELQNGFQVTARVSGKIRMNTIRILAGDSVTVELSPTDLTHGIIKYRNNGGSYESKSIGKKNMPQMQNNKKKG